MLGLRALHGEPDRGVWYKEADGPNPVFNGGGGSQLYPGSLLTSTPVSLSTCARDFDDALLAGHTNANDNVSYFSANGWGFNMDAGMDLNVPDPQWNPVKTYDRVAVARGIPVGSQDPVDERRLFAWIGGGGSACCEEERTDTFNIRVRWRTHVNGIWYAPGSYGPTPYKNLSAGYDPYEDLFLVAFEYACAEDPQGICQPTGNPKDNAIAVATIDADGVYTCGQALKTVGNVLEIGDISCDATAPSSPSICYIPVSTSTEDGPKLQIFEVEVVPHDDSVCFVRYNWDQGEIPMTYDIEAIGGVNTAIDPYALTGRLLVGYREDVAQVEMIPLFTTPRDAQGRLIGTVDNVQPQGAGGWPLRVGSQCWDGSAWAPGPPIWKVMTYGAAGTGGVGTSGATSGATSVATTAATSIG